jgi:hypothetical protein
MSNHSAKAKVRQKQTSETGLSMKIAIAVLVCLMITFPLYQHVLDHSSAGWPSVAAHVLETRITVVGTQDHAYRAGEIDYQVEAHVVYELNGIHHDGWLPASGISADRIYLQYWLSQRKSKLCIVHWNPHNPSDIEVVLS